MRNEMIDPKHLEQFNPKFAPIIREELENGNRIVETSLGWPEPDTLIVFLEKPFTRDYIHLNLTYREINDPHYWKAEYFDEVSGHILACKYGDQFSKG